MAERLRLFLVIALGEVVLTSATAIAEAPTESLTLLAGVAAFVLVAALWAFYFAGSPVIVERQEAAPTADPIWTARMGANGQYVVLAGLVMTAVGCETVIAHPLGAGSFTVGLLLGGGPLLYVATQIFRCGPCRALSSISAYAAAKFGLEGWMESLQPEAEPFGIATTIVNPGFFRTDLLTQESTTYATPSIADYADRHAQRVQWYETMNGQQAGDPAKLARAHLTIAGQEQPPRRFLAGADAIAIAEQKAKDLQEQADAYRALSSSLAHDDAQPA